MGNSEIGEEAAHPVGDFLPLGPFAGDARGFGQLSGRRLSRRRGQVLLGKGQPALDDELVEGHELAVEPREVAGSGGKHLAGEVGLLLNVVDIG